MIEGASTPAHLPSVSTAGETYTLRLGDNTLGGESIDAIAIARFAHMAPTAQITVLPDGSATIRHLGGRPSIRIGKQRIGGQPHLLHDGDRIQVGRRRLRYSAAGRPPVAAAPTLLRGALPAIMGRGRLIDGRSGHTFDLATPRTTVGRDTTCDIVMTAPGVSRRHVSIVARDGGFVLRDESVNGTMVNDQKVEGERSLAHGDVIRIDTETLSFELVTEPEASEAALTVVAPMAALATMLFPQAGTPASNEGPPSEESRPLATLEVRTGRDRGTRHLIVRAVNVIGRADSSDVRLHGQSVSASHATLLLKGERWFVVDLDSSNGTYVDGYRISGERGLTHGCVLRAGDVEMIFEIVPRLSGAARGTRPIVGLIERFQKLW